MPIWSTRTRYMLDSTSMLSTLLLCSFAAPFYTASFTFFAASALNFRVTIYLYIYNIPTDAMYTILSQLFLKIFLHIFYKLSIQLRHSSKVVWKKFKDTNKFFSQIRVCEEVYSAGDSKAIRSNGPNEHSPQLVAFSPAVLLFCVSNTFFRIKVLFYFLSHLLTLFRYYFFLYLEKKYMCKRNNLHLK